MAIGQDSVVSENFGVRVRVNCVRQSPVKRGNVFLLPKILYSMGDW